MDRRPKPTAKVFTPTATATVAEGLGPKLRPKVHQKYPCLMTSIAFCLWHRVGTLTCKNGRMSIKTTESVLFKKVLAYLVPDMAIKIIFSEFAH